MNFIENLLNDYTFQAKYNPSKSYRAGYFVSIHGLINIIYVFFIKAKQIISEDSLHISNLC